MTTAYMSIIEEKEDLTLREFVLRCARVCAAMSHVSDSSLSSDLPPRVADTSYCEKELSMLVHERGRLADLSEEEVRLEVLTRYERACKYRAASLAHSQLLRERYARMLGLVTDWAPPSEAHSDLKRFMRMQIIDSAEMLVSAESFPAPKLEDVRDYRTRQLAQVENEISYYRWRIAEERSRAERSNAWIRELLASLPEEGTPGEVQKTLENIDAYAKKEAYR